MEALQLQKHDEWLAEHLDELVTQYPGKVVAIYDLEELEEDLRTLEALG